MHDFSARTLDRVDRFIREQLPRALVRRRAPLTLAAWEVGGEPVPFATAAAAEYTPFTTGERFGRPWDTTWFHVTGRVPDDWDLDEGVEIRVEFDLGFNSAMPGFQCEGAVWTSDGVLSKSIHPRNRWAPCSPGRPGDDVEFYLEAASNPMVPGENDWTTPTPMGDRATAGDDLLYRVVAADIVAADLTAEALRLDVHTLRRMLDHLSPDQPRRHEILTALERMLNVVDPHDVGATAAAARRELEGVLASPAATSAHRIHAVGHAHIDSAWLWPTRETVRKCARTFSNVVALMEEEPELRFACSSAQQYAWVKEHYPELFERIRAKVASGQFVPVGGMWVESDTNMPGGEAFVRQFLTGTRFFIDEFGVEPLDVWLPDSFGYTAALPQIARLAGKRYFLTQKISWNDTNTFPHHTFWWEGIDGSRIFTHFPPADTYNSDLDFRDIVRAERQYAEKGRANDSLLPFGYGDGGGGPTREMVQLAHRHADLEGSPRVQLSHPHEFFADALAGYPDAPVWNGEMYLEYHRGTYTSQHRTKAGNRRSEHLLREAELWCATAAVRVGHAYPAAELDRLWKLVLLQQFHDILPGTSIAWVYHDSDAVYAEVDDALQKIITDALGALVGDGDTELVANARPHADAGVPALGIGAAAPSSAGARAALTGEGIVLENAALRAVLDDGGRFVSIRHLASGREVVPDDTPLGRLLLCRDIPNEWDAWDINSFYRDVVEEWQADAVEVTGEAEVSVAFTRGDTRLTQTIRLDEEGLIFDFDVDWHERQLLLKWDLPLDVHADVAQSEIQFGHVTRPTAVNTSWDAARFETPAHRWVRVAEPGFGVALTNSSTYGYAITRDVATTPEEPAETTTTIRPSLLRAPLFPDPEADQGRHQFSFALLVGAEVTDAIAGGYRRNLPRRVVSGARGVEPLLEVTGALVEAVKLAEDGSGDVVVRLYESEGRRVKAHVTAGFDVVEALETDLLERPLGDVDLSGALEFRPFQIRTLRLRR